MAAPSLGLELGIAPSSGAQTGADWFSDQPNFTFGGVDFGEDGISQTPITGLVRDLAVGVAVALLAKWMWGYIS